MGRLSKIIQECLQKSKNASIYKQIGRNRPIDAFNPHQRSGLNTSNQIVTNRRDRQISDGRSRCILAMCVIKRIKRRPLDRDPMIAMRFHAMNLSRYNACI